MTRKGDTKGNGRLPRIDESTSSSSVSSLAVSPSIPSCTRVVQDDVAYPDPGKESITPHFPFPFPSLPLPQVISAFFLSSSPLFLLGQPPVVPVITPSPSPSLSSSPSPDDYSSGIIPVQFVFSCLLSASPLEIDGIDASYPRSRTPVTLSLLSVLINQLRSSNIGIERERGMD